MGRNGHWIKCVFSAGFLLICIIVAPANAAPSLGTTFQTSSTEEESLTPLHTTPLLFNTMDVAPNVQQTPAITLPPRPSPGKTPKGSCSTPPDLPNSDVVSGWSEDIYKEGDLVTYACHSGFTDIQARSFSIVCESDHDSPGKLRWSSPYFLCQITCGRPENPANGFVEGKFYTFGSTVTFKCRRGYFVFGANNSTCQDDGNWDNLVPECREVECEKPPWVENAEAAFNIGDDKTITYECQPGFILDGNSTFQCLDDGTWGPKDHLPYCRPLLMCKHPPPIANALQLWSTRPSYELGTNVRYRCNPGYTVSRDSSYFIVCINIDGLAKWTPQKLKCQPKQCSFPGEIENGYFNGTNFMYGAKIVYHCNHGFIMGEKQMTRECMADGNWSPSSPVCEPVQCPEPREIPHGTITVPSSLIFDSVIQYRCNGKMQLMGPSLRTCQADSTWSGREPICMAVLCPPLKNIENGKWLGGEDTDSVVRFSCNEGFLLAGQSTATCLPNGQWSGYPPTCQPVCPPPTLDRYAAVPQIIRDKQYFTVGERVEFHCGGGYHGWSYTLVCNKWHTWQQVEKHFLYPLGWKCLAFCYRPTPNLNAVLARNYEHIDFYPVGKYAYFDCKLGYTSEAKGYYTKCLVDKRGETYWVPYKNVRCIAGRGWH
uniref:Sushi, von Willebrand factor type A, EGF and pentraxin domain-containing protein 1-like isoform X5 n=1 Tax=Petromyzon marinus TaxID=7757 RepID=A0AAJ7U4R2_PETMA|nr:sushi, von Willebrand factor type A, EGF and pentraxin domain-containing protein 1-like isoform X5 [Petromyzon marinus]